MEEIDTPLSMNSSSLENPTSSSVIPKVRIISSTLPAYHIYFNWKQVSRTIRTPRQLKQKDADGPVKDTKEKRGRKRKIRDEELPPIVSENGNNLDDRRDIAKPGKEEKTDKADKQDKESRKSKRTPARAVQLQPANQETPPTSSAAPLLSPTLSITPSLKIRLPRLSNLNTSNNSFALSTPHLDSPTRR